MFLRIQLNAYVLYTPADILVGTYSQDELGIKCPLEYLQVHVGDHPCFYTFYLFDPNWL